MKKVHLISAIILSTFLLLFSCSNDDENFPNSQNVDLNKMKAKAIAKTLSEQEKKDLIENKNLKGLTDEEKAAFLFDMYKSYGWVVDEEVSEIERLEMLKKADPYETIKLMWLSQELDDNKLVSMGEIILTNQTKASGNFAIQGNHSSYFVTSVSEMVLSYNTNSNDISVVSSRVVKSNPSISWSQSGSGTTAFNNNKATAWATGVAKSSGLKRNMKMEGYMTRYASSKLPSGGKVERFREGS